MKYSVKARSPFLRPTDEANCHCFKSGATLIGMDFAASEGDWSTEVEYEMLPDGKMQIRDIRQWRHEIEHND